jgi:hypothetical protein
MTRRNWARYDNVHLDATICLLDPDLEPKAIPTKRICQSDGWLCKENYSEA